MELDFSKAFKFKNSLGYCDMIFEAYPNITTRCLNVPWQNPSSGIFNTTVIPFEEAKLLIDGGTWEIVKEPPTQSEAMLSLEDYIKAIHKDNKEFCQDDICECFEEEMSLYERINSFVAGGSCNVEFCEDFIAIYSEYLEKTFYVLTEAELITTLEAIETLADLGGK